MYPVWAACSKPRRVVLIQGLKKTELPQAPGGTKERITAEPSLRVQAAHLCGCCASNPNINSSKVLNTSEKFWKHVFASSLVLPIQEKTRVLRPKWQWRNHECQNGDLWMLIIKLYEVYKATEVCSSYREFGHKLCNAIQQWLSHAQSDLQLPTLWQACHRSCTFSSLDSTSVQLGDSALWSARFMIKYSDRLAHKEKWTDGKASLNGPRLEIFPQVTWFWSLTMCGWKIARENRPSLLVSLQLWIWQAQNDRRYTWQYSACLTLNDNLDIIWLQNVAKHLQLGLLLHIQVLKPLY